MYRIDTPADSRSGFSRGIQVAALLDLLGDKEIDLVCRQLGHAWRNRIFTPAVTVRSMVYRALNPDKSIRAVMADLAVSDDRIRHAPAGASWCEARARLPEPVFGELIQHSVRRLERLTAGQFLFENRRVFWVDGSTLSMPDTPELVEQFGYFNSTHGPSRFPVGKITFIIRAGSDAVWDFRFAGCRTSETEQFHEMWDRIPRDSICVFDRHFSSFYNMTKLRQRRIDCISRLHQMRAPEQLIARGKRIGRNDWMVWLDLQPHRRKQYDDPTLPKRLRVRLIRLKFTHNGKPKLIWLVTTLLDARRYSKKAIGELYRGRWGIETRIAELKTTLQMNVLRSMSVRAVRFEVAATILAYNLLRTVIHQAARQHKASPDRISFASAVKMVLAYSVPLRTAATTQRGEVYTQMLADIARCRNLARPNRVEPRLIKRDGKKYPWLKIPRALARARC